MAEVLRAVLPNDIVYVIDKKIKAMQEEEDAELMRRLKEILGPPAVEITGDNASDCCEDEHGNYISLNDSDVED